jgi:hypothetical protein
MLNLAFSMVMLNASMQSVVKLNVVAPHRPPASKQDVKKVFKVVKTKSESLRSFKKFHQRTLKICLSKTVIFTFLYGHRFHIMSLKFPKFK